METNFSIAPNIYFKKKVMQSCSLFCMGTMDKLIVCMDRKLASTDLFWVNLVV